VRHFQRRRSPRYLLGRHRLTEKATREGPFHNGRTRIGVGNGENEASSPLLLTSVNGPVPVIALVPKERPSFTPEERVMVAETVQRDARVDRVGNPRLLSVMKPPLWSPMGLPEMVMDWPPVEFRVTEPSCTPAPRLYVFAPAQGSELTR